MKIELIRTGVMKRFSELSYRDWFFYRHQYLIRTNEMAQILVDGWEANTVDLDGNVWNILRSTPAEDFIVELVEKKVVDD